MSVTALILITAITAWHLLRHLPFETLASPSDVLALILGTGLAAGVALLGTRAAPGTSTGHLAIAASIFILTVAEYLLDFPSAVWLDPIVALSWIALGACLVSSRWVGPVSDSARLCFRIGITIEIAELLRSIVTIAMYGHAEPPAALQWLESESDLLLRTAYIIGVIELFLQAPESARFDHGNWSDAALTARAQTGYAKFKAENPGADIGAYYASRVIQRLDAGHGHPTLGKRKRGSKLPFLRRPLRSEEFRHDGLGQFKDVLRAGLRPYHVCVDYGCGSLRVGQHLIDYLDAGSYWGLDVVDRFFRDGFEMLPQECKDKTPNLRVINAATLAEAAKARPDFVVCFAVLTHVPPEELSVVIDRILGLADEEAVIVLSYYEAEVFFHRAQVCFTHRAGAIEELVLARRPGAELRVRRQPRSNKRMPEWETFLEIRPAS